MSFPRETRHVTNVDRSASRYDGHGRGHLRPDRMGHLERVPVPEGCHEREVRNLAAAVIALAFEDVERERAYYPDEGDAAAFLSGPSLWLDVLGWEPACLCGRPCRKG